jgi:hypothetical protein
VIGTGAAGRRRIIFQPEVNSLMTTTALKEYTLKDLAQMAKKRGILGWHSMRKHELIRALIRNDKQATKSTIKNGGKTRLSRKPAVDDKAGRVASRVVATATVGRNGRSSGHSGAATGGMASEAIRPSPSRGKSTSKLGTGKVAVEAVVVGHSPVARPKISSVARKIQRAHRQQEQFKDLSGASTPIAIPAAHRTAVPARTNGTALPTSERGKDRVVLMVRDPYWLHVHWEMSSRSIQRAQAAMAEYWHTAKPVIRLMEVARKATTSTTETFVRDVAIHGGVNNWYLDVVDPPRAYRVEIGYLASNGRFHGLARSNSVATPEPGAHDALDRTWVDVAENCERIFALSGGYSAENSADELQEVLEERLRRPVGSLLASRYGVGADPTLEKDAGFRLDVDAEMIVYGSTRPGAHVTLAGEPIKLRDDGSFTVRMSLPERRQVLPVTSSSSDGMTQQTVVLAVERNTKIMEAVLRDTSQ